MADSKKYDGSQWQHSLRKLTTATEAVENPLYSDGTAITSYTISGNTVQNGTPTPDNPVDAVGVGTLDSGQYKIPISSGGVTTNIYLGSTQSVRQVKKLVLTGQEDWRRFSTTDDYYFYPGNLMLPKSRLIATHYTYATSRGTAINNSVFTNTGGGENIWLRADVFEGDVSAVKTYLQQQYAAGTPVTVWYVLATPETAAVNEPLMKIGDYADTLSNAASIPTTEGANSITVDATVQPSEFTATWTGWHNANVKEWDGSDWR